MNTTSSALPFPVTPRLAGEAEADLLGFGLLHRAIRSGTRQLAVAIGEIAGGGPCPPERLRALQQFATNVLDELEVHHQREDDVLWPVVAVSAGPHIDLSPLVDDHVALHLLVGAARDALLGVTSDPARNTGQLAGCFAELADEVDQHLDDEEATVFPVIRTFVSKRDFDHCEKLFTKGSSFKRLWFMLPWIVEQCTPEELVEVRAGAPLLIRIILRVASPRWRRLRDLAVGPVACQIRSSG